MEVLGAVASTITLAALFKSCFTALDLFELYQTQDDDFNRMKLDFLLEKGRLYIWGLEMSLTDDSRPNCLRGYPLESLVARCLLQIQSSFSDAEAIRRKYDVSQLSDSLPASERFNTITRAFDNFRFKSSTGNNRRRSSVKKCKWIIRDRKKFKLLLSDVRGYNDRLKEITNILLSSARSDDLLSGLMNGITDVDTLRAVGSAWQETHPRVASVASTRAEIISVSSKIPQSSSDDGVVVDTRIAELENMTPTELRHLILQSYQVRAGPSHYLQAMKGQLDILGSPYLKCILRLAVGVASGYFYLKMRWVCSPGSLSYCFAF
ncbi:small s [Fusarium beomiforme]|uniref:Small s n=1 Tax=Fusarium beomiforme TaxID=44412 RepID=A0A9P5AGI4_9HYPO|nr:small s [Fusarium beomiforme]